MILLETNIGPLFRHVHVVGLNVLCFCDVGLLSDAVSISQLTLLWKRNRILILLLITGTSIVR